MTDKALQDAMLAAAEEVATPEVKPIRDVTFYPDIKPVLTSNYLIKDVINRDSNVLMIGDSGAGKTFLAVDMCLCIAAGIAWRGKKTKRGRVLYCAAEAGASIARRVEAWRVHHKVYEADFAIRTLSLNLLDQADAARLIDLCVRIAEEHGGIALIVIDTVSRSMPGADENSAEAMTEYVRVCDAIRSATGAAILLVHHKGKDSSRGARGHSSLKAAVDTEIDVAKSGDCKTATINKQRDGESGTVFRFALKPIEIGRDDEDEIVTSCVIVDEDQEVEQVDPETYLNQRQRAGLHAIRDYVEAHGSDQYRGAIEGKKAVSKDHLVEHLLPFMTGLSVPARQREAAKRVLETLERLNLIVTTKTRVRLP